MEETNIDEYDSYIKDCQKRIAKIEKDIAKQEQVISEANANLPMCLQAVRDAEKEELCADLGDGLLGGDVG